MTSVETELRTALIADAGINAVLGNRLYWPTLPQQPQYPVAIFRRVSTQMLRSHGTQVGGIRLPGTGWCRISFTIWSDLSPTQTRGSSSGAADELNSVVQAILAALNHINLCAVPESPVTTLSAPNFFLGLRDGVESNVQPPLPVNYLDVMVWFSDQ